MLIGALLPQLTSDYSFDEIESERQNVIAFTGESMTNVTPWKLTHVYTPYIYGESYNIDENGFLYGQEVTTYDQIGKTTAVYLNKDQKSSTTLNNETVTIEKTKTVDKWYYNRELVDWFPTTSVFIYSILHQTTGFELTEEVTYTAEYETFQHTGWRYMFDPMLPFNYSENDPNQASAKDGSLSIIWYNVNGNEGLSGGLVVKDRQGAIISNFSAADIIFNYDTSNGYASKYNFDFEGTRLYLLIRFDSDVISESIPLETAWSEGRWSLAITSASAGNFIDIKNSTSFTDSLGSMVDTFIDIYKFDVPNVDLPLYNFILWMLVIFPAELALMFFLKSVFGMAGVGAGLVANILAMTL